MSCYEYGKLHGLLDEEGWKKLKRCAHFIEQSQLKIYKAAAGAVYNTRFEPFIQFGVQVPHHHKEEGSDATRCEEWRYQMERCYLHGIVQHHLLQRFQGSWAGTIRAPRSPADTKRSRHISCSMPNMMADGERPDWLQEATSRTTHSSRYTPGSCRYGECAW
jgi:hypothetical protein